MYKVEFTLFMPSSIGVRFIKYKSIKILKRDGIKTMERKLKELSSGNQQVSATS